MSKEKATETPETLAQKAIDDFKKRNKDLGNGFYELTNKRDQGRFVGYNGFYLTDNQIVLVKLEQPANHGFTAPRDFFQNLESKYSISFPGWKNAREKHFAAGAYFQGVGIHEKTAKEPHAFLILSKNIASGLKKLSFTLLNSKSEKETHSLSIVMNAEGNLSTHLASEKIAKQAMPLDVLMPKIGLRGRTVEARVERETAKKQRVAQEEQDPIKSQLKDDIKTIHAIKNLRKLSEYMRSTSVDDLINIFNGKTVAANFPAAGLGEKEVIKADYQLALINAINKDETLKQKIYELTTYHKELATAIFQEEIYTKVGLNSIFTPQQTIDLLYQYSGSGGWGNDATAFDRAILVGAYPKIDIDALAKQDFSILNTIAKKTDYQLIRIKDLDAVVAHYLSQADSNTPLFPQSKVEVQKHYGDYATAVAENIAKRANEPQAKYAQYFLAQRYLLKAEAIAKDDVPKVTAEVNRAAKEYQEAKNWAMSPTGYYAEEARQKESMRDAKARELEKLKDGIKTLMDKSAAHLEKAAATGYQPAFSALFDIAKYIALGQHGITQNIDKAAKMFETLLADKKLDAGLKRDIIKFVSLEQPIKEKLMQKAEFKELLGGVNVTRARSVAGAPTPRPGGFKR